MTQTKLVDIITKRPFAKPNIRYEAMHELVELLCPKFERIKSPKGGPDVLPRTQACDRAAKLTGMSHAAVIRMGHRRKSWCKYPWLQQFGTFDMDLDEAFLGEIDKEFKALATQADRLTRVAKFTSDRGMTGTGSLKKIRKSFLDHRPASLCPYCKAQEDIQADCGNCEGVGWFRKCQMEKVPGRFMFTDPMVVVVGGEEVELE